MVIKASNLNGVHRDLLRVDEARGRSVDKIASGRKINRGSDDPAGLSMLMAFESQSRSLFKQIGNRQDDISLLQTAEKALDSSGQIVQRLGELALQAANGTISDADRGNIQIEADQLREQLDQNAANTSYNDKPLLDGSLTLTGINGETISLPAANSQVLAVDSIDLTTSAGAEKAISVLALASEKIAAQRGSLGASINAASAHVASLQNEFVNATSAQARIQDTDMAAEIINLSLNELQSRFAIKAFRIQDENRSTILGLLQDQ